MPERPEIESKLQEQAKQVEDALSEMQKDYELKVQEFQNNPDWTEATKSSKYNAIVSLEQDMKEFAMNAEKELNDNEGKLMQPMIDRARKAIDDVAKEGGYTYIFDSSESTLLYEGGEDIMPLVKAKLGME